MSDGHLITGWEPDLDAGDTLLRAQVYNLASRYRFAAERANAPLVDDDLLVGVQLVEGTGWGNDAVLLQPFREASVGPLLGRLRELPEPSNLWSAWPTPDLTGHGLVLFGHPPAMLRPPGGEAPPALDGVRFVEADTDEAMHDYDQTVIHGFPLRRSDGTPLDRVLRPTFRGGPWRFFVAYVDERPVAAASVFTACGVAQVEWVATLPDFRGRGIGEAVTWRATLARPDVPAVLVASDVGRPIYERMGFLPIQRFTLWYWPGEKA